MRVQTEFFLEKSEAELVRGLAKSRFRPTAFGKPAIGEAVAFLLRVAFNCFREHGDYYRGPEPISEAQAQEEGLSIPQTKKKLKTASRRHRHKEHGDDGRFE